MDAVPVEDPAIGSPHGTSRGAPEVLALTGRRDDRIMRAVVAKVAHQFPARQPLQLAIGERVEVG
jgi:hypothetical protein